MQSTLLKTWSLAIVAALLISLLVVNQSAYAQTDKPKIVHDAEYYILDVQYRWQRIFNEPCKELDS